MDSAWCHDQEIFQTTPHGATRLVQGTHRHTFPVQQFGGSGFLQLGTSFNTNQLDTTWMWLRPGGMGFNLPLVRQFHIFDSV